MRTLYHTPLSPFCRKIRVLLKEKALEAELKNEPVWERRTDFFALNPAGEVPVLQDENGLIVSGSYAIAEYLEEGYQETNFIGQTLRERAEVRRLVTWFDFKFYHEVTQKILYEKVFRQLTRDGGPNSEAIRAGKNNMLYHLDYIAHLTKERTWLAGESFSLADISAAAHLSSLDYIGDVPWSHNPSVKDWYALVKCRPSFRLLLKDRIMGFIPPEHYEDLDF